MFENVKKGKHFFSKVIICGSSIYIIDYPDLLVINLKENCIGLKGKLIRICPHEINVSWNL